jgi:hypothetical protein
MLAILEIVKEATIQFQNGKNQVQERLRSIQTQTCTERVCGGGLGAVFRDDEGQILAAAAWCFPR